MFLSSTSKNKLLCLGISIDYGFMLFQPDTTYNSLNDNLKFLELICMDGYMPVSFFKMMPYLETQIEKELRKKGRLKGIPGFLDYDYFDNTLNDFQHFVFNSFNTWFSSPKGLLNISKWANIYHSVYSFYNGIHTGIQHLSNELSTQVSDSNRFMIETLKELSTRFESGSYNVKNDKELDYYRSKIEEQHHSALKNITGIITKIELFSLTKHFLTW